MKTFADVTAHLSRLAEICTAYRQDALDELTQTHGDEWGRIVSELFTVGPDRGRPRNEGKSVLSELSTLTPQGKVYPQRDHLMNVALDAVADDAKAEERTRIVNLLRDFIGDLGVDENE